MQVTSTAVLFDSLKLVDQFDFFVAHIAYIFAGNIYKCEKDLINVSGTSLYTAIL